MGLIFVKVWVAIFMVMFHFVTDLKAYNLTVYVIVVVVVGILVYFYIYSLTWYTYIQLCVLTALNAYHTPRPPSDLPQTSPLSLMWSDSRCVGGRMVWREK